jgi:hypothetical protein
VRRADEPPRHAPVTANPHRGVMTFAPQTFEKRICGLRIRRPPHIRDDQVEPVVSNLVEASSVDVLITVRTSTASKLYRS